MKLLHSFFFGTAIALTGCSNMSATSTSPTRAPVVPAQGVSFLQPVDGAIVTSPFVVKFEVTGMLVRPAGTMTPETGHHHLLINVEPIAAMGAIPMDEQHLHFGNGQSETTLNLKPGKYRLTMQFGNGLHQAYGPTMNKSIDITVQ